MSQNQHIFVVTGLGLRCSVGQNAVQSCASVRAGIDRFGEWPHMSDLTDSEGAGIVGAAVIPDLGDENWTVKFSDLATQPLLEALWAAKLYDLTQPRERTGLYLATPALNRPGAEEHLSGFAQELREGRLLPVKFDLCFTCPTEHAGAFMALDKAMQDLMANAVDVCIVGGVDSPLHSEYLMSLISTRKLKISATPAGRIPGEAAAFVVVETAKHAESRGAKPLARLAPVKTAMEPNAANGKPTRGEALSRVLQEAFSQSACPPQRMRRVMADLNGERGRFLEWGMAYGRALSQLPPNRQLWHPADCLGDIGAATGAAYLCIAARAFARGYAGGDAILICTSSDTGERAAVGVLAPGATTGGA